MHTTAACVSILAFFSSAIASRPIGKEENRTLAPRGKKFEVLSKPVTLGFGQVNNEFQKPKPLPEDVVKDLAKGDHVLTGYHADVVEFSEDGEVLGSVPLYDAYLHHYAGMMGDRETLELFWEQMHGLSLPMKRVQAAFHDLAATHTGEDKKHKTPNFFGGGSGAEERHTKHVYPEPYGDILKQGTNSFMPLMHLINTRGDVEPGSTYSSMAECPCSSDRDIDTEAGTIDGRRPNIPFGGCSASLLIERNTACSLQSYVGGFRCCEHLWWVSDPERRADKPVALYGMRFTFYYEPLVPGTIPLRSSSCCDATASMEALGQIEYDIPQCNPRVDEECLHTLVSYQYLDVPGKGTFLDPTAGGMTPEEAAEIDAGRQVEIVYAVGHQHLGAAPVGIKLFKDATNELLCSSTPILGTGTEPGNERGYLVGMTPCIWGTPGGQAPPRLRRDTVVRVESTYNNTNPHYGVMSLWLMNLADVPVPSSMEADDDALRRPGVLQTY